MTKFILIYKGEATDMAAMTEEQSQEVMAKWGAWMQKIGGALADIGSPMGPSTSMIDDGSTGKAAAVTGYSIIEAADMQGAVALTEGHPYLSEGKGNYAVDIYELLPVPM
jgi:hypothetical protein